MDYEKKYKEALERAKQFSEKPYLEDSKGIVEYIFPELAESEDERIRKSLIDMLKNDEKCYLKEIAWLEKQGEQKPVPKFKVGDVIRLKGSAAEYTIKKVTDTTYYTNGWSCGIERCEEDYELVEQKPYGLREECKDCQCNYAGECKGSCAMKRNEQKPWGKEDENLLKLSLENLTELKDIYGENYGRVGGCIDWLESLKDRVLSQREWSEEDEQYLLVCKNALAKYQASDKWDAEIISHWLENKLKARQNKWKPSDEQITVINDTIRFIEDKSDSLSSDYLYNKMKELLEQLKAL